MDLNNVLSDYDARKASERNAAESKRETERAILGEALRVIKAHIVPEINAIAEQLRAKNHGTSIKPIEEKVLNPSITLELTPSSLGDEFSHAIPSRISFHHVIEGGLKVIHEIHSKQGGTSRQADARDVSVSYETVTRDWARQTLVSFVKDVLAVN